MRSMQFSAKSEYACIAMLELAARHDDHSPVRLKDIADAHGIPQRFLVQILLQLKGSGLVVSARGAAGGYLLARSPDQITIGDIVGLIDRNERLASRGDSFNSPWQAVIRDVWREVQSAQQRILESTTLASLVQQVREGDSLVYQI